MTIQNSLIYDTTDLLFSADGCPARAKKFFIAAIAGFASLTVVATTVLLLVLFFASDAFNLYPYLILCFIVGYAIDAVIFAQIFIQRKQIECRSKTNFVITERGIIGLFKNRYYYSPFSEIRRLKVFYYGGGSVNRFLVSNHLSMPVKPVGGKINITVHDTTYNFLCSDLCRAERLLNGLLGYNYYFRAY